jgi:pyruvate dehydrogenase E2 component (dihydrolipoamide acetyltransferase)
MADFRMPSLGADMEEGTVLEWLVHPGDVVHKGDIVAVVDTAKAAVEVETFVEGVVSESCSSTWGPRCRWHPARPDRR